MRNVTEFDLYKEDQSDEHNIILINQLRILNEQVRCMAQSIEDQGLIIQGLLTRGLSHKDR